MPLILEATTFQQWMLGMPNEAAALMVPYGGAIEACARKLFVHPNTVRYRLKRIADFTGRDPTVPRDAYVLRVAATVGRIGRQAALSSTPNGIVMQVTPGVLAPSGRSTRDR